ncbi:unnamed protein product [Adineta steineri]|uniref:Nucleolar protein 10 n=1 Tax=Adineta steineri TaxID=433720 RepID=A0A815ACP0_9BILA|nr:unnamed protein product [Adineta steineri]CAF4086025.1 unnamed protein product [Adineta steineri]
MLSYTQLREVQSVEASDDSTVDDCENELSEYDTRIETLKEQKSNSENNKADPAGNPIQSVHSAKFSLIDQYSSQRLKLKRRYRLLLTQTPFTKC